MLDLGTNLRDVRTEWSKSIGMYEQVVTDEIRARLTHWSDPAIPGFKLFIDFDAKTGLFADEKYVNSALAFLKRAGEEHRYNQLKSFIIGFKAFLQEWDFLILNCEGLGEVISQVPGQFPHNDDDQKISFSIRETLEYRFATLMFTYNRIVYDYVRGVEVIPTNLKKFTCYVLVYQQGMYSEDLYGTWRRDTSKLPKDNLVLPTYMKLFWLRGNYKNNNEFKNFLFMLSGCSFNTKESTKQMFNEITNEANAEPGKNQLVINWKFGQYYQRGRGGDDYANYSDDSEQDALAGALGVFAQINRERNLMKFAKKKAAEAAKNFKKAAVRGVVSGLGQIHKKIDTLGKQAVDSLIGPKTPLGQTLDLAMNPDRLIQKYGTDWVLGQMDQFAQKNVFSHIAKFNSFLISLNPELQLAIINEENKTAKNIEVFPESATIKPGTMVPPNQEQIFLEAQNIIMPQDEQQSKVPNIMVSELSNKENAFDSPNFPQLNTNLNLNQTAPKIGLFSSRQTF